MTSQIIELADRKSGATARVLVSLGFNCFSWQPVLADGPREMLWAPQHFERGEERPSSGGTPLLFPFPGRIGGARFSFNGRDYQLEPGDPFGNAIHGFVYNRAWRIVERGESRVVGEFQASQDDPSLLERWPSDFRIRTSYELRGQKLLSEIRYENAGTDPLPCGFGTHAYFRLPLAEGSRVNDTIVTAPVHGYWELEQMIPTGRRSKVSADQSLADGLPLADHQFDTVFTEVRPDADGLVRTRLADSASGRTLEQTFGAEFTQCVVYTPGHREAVCVEPYTCVPDPFRLGDDEHETGLQVLQPGEQRSHAIALTVG